MAVTQDKSGPYAPAPAVMGIVERFRDRGLPTPITSDVLLRAGVSESLVPRTLYALQVLDLIDSEGSPTPIFETIRRAPEGEYKARLAEWLSNAYSDILAYVDPATTDEGKLHDQFRSYNPAGQRARMVTLFIGLFRAAGMMPEKASGKAGPVVRRKTSSAPPLRVKTALTPPPATGGRGAGATLPAGLHPAIAGLLAGLPTPDQGWTKADRERFMTAFGVVLDFAYPFDIAPRRKIQTAEADDADA